MRTTCLIFLALLLAVSGEESCIDWRLEPYFGTARPLPDASWHIPPTPLELKSVQVVARHGTRYPTSGFLSDFARLEDELRSNLPPPTTRLAERLLATNLSAEFPEAEAGLLARRGVEEHLLLGLGLRGSLGCAGTAWRSTERDRTVRSAQAFAYGLCSAPGFFNPVFLRTHNISTDTVLHFWTCCPAYQRSFNDNIDAYKKLRYPPIAEAIAERLGTPWTPSFDAVLSMWRACVSGSRPYCDVFSESDALWLAYGEDLREYISKSYGAPEIAYRMSCPLVELLARWQSGVYLTHAEALFPLQVVLGLYRETLSFDMDASRVRSRVWNTSRILTYGSTLAFFLYEDPAGAQYVLTLHQGCPVRPEGCPSVHCPLPIFSALLDRVLPCRFEEICQ